MKGIGNTPLIKLQKVTGPDMADIFIKYEGANLTGSMKDRMALSIIENAEKKGSLKKGMKLIEYTGGSTGTSLAMVCAKKGYQAHFITSNAFSNEKLKSMKAFGATLEIIHAKDDILNAEVIDRMIKRTNELAQDPNVFWPDQFNNLDNKLGYHSMANEILEELGTNINEFVMAVGGGGCISGNAEVLKNQIPSIKITAIEPYYVRNISGGKTDGSHKLEGIGLSFVPKILRKDLVDQVVSVKDQDAYSTAKLLAQREGILGGATSGANVWAAIQRAKKIGPGHTIVTVACDTGIKYLHGSLFE